MEKGASGIGTVKPPTACPCQACRLLERTRLGAIAATNQAANRMMAVSQDVIDLWNEVVRNHECQNSRNSGGGSSASG